MIKLLIMKIFTTCLHEIPPEFDVKMCVYNLTSCYERTANIETCLEYYDLDFNIMEADESF